MFRKIALSLMLMVMLVPSQAAAASRSFDTPLPTNTPAPTFSPTRTLDAEDEGTSDPVGPDTYPDGINPLTGLPVEDLENLVLPPALVSITNFPVTARPQAGLSFSPMVFEMYIGQGDSRFLALFYGDYPQAPEGAEANATTTNADPSIGPVRSGRLPYEPIRKQYTGFLVMASAYETIAAQLSDYTNIFASDSGDINSAMLDVTKLEKIAQASQHKIDENALNGNLFDAAVPDGGQDGTKVWLPYAYLNQLYWQYDKTSGAYNRYQDKADGVTFEQATDRVNGDPLTYENVVILFAQHHAYAETVIDIDFGYISRMPALIFRDGQMYKAFWTTANGEYEKKTGKLRPIRFIDEEGNPFPMKPGQTWVEIVPTGTAYRESVDSENYFDLIRKTDPGSGVWSVLFKAPPIEEQ